MVSDNLNQIDRLELFVTPSPPQEELAAREERLAVREEAFGQVESFGHSKHRVKPCVACDSRESALAWAFLRCVAVFM